MSRPRAAWERSFRLVRTAGKLRLDSRDWCPHSILDEVPPSLVEIQRLCRDGDEHDGGPAFLACILASVSYWCRAWSAMYSWFRDIGQLNKKARDAAWEEASLAVHVLIRRPKSRVLKTRAGIRRRRTRKVHERLLFLPYHLEDLATPYFDRALELLAADKDRAFLDEYRANFHRIVEAVASPETPFWDISELERGASGQFEDWRGHLVEMGAFLRDTHALVRALVVRECETSDGSAADTPEPTVPRPKRWRGEWITHGEAAHILRYRSRQSGCIASGDTLRKAIASAEDGSPLAELRDKTVRGAKSPTGKLRRDAVEWVAQQRSVDRASGDVENDGFVRETRNEHGKTRNEHAPNAE